jgi:hypothetical protein
VAQQHQQWNSSRKMSVRKAVLTHFQSVTGLDTMPEGNTVLALCGRQQDAPGYQVNQYVDDGFIQSCQYVGVDNDPDIIAYNQEQHPHAVFECGDWRSLFPRLLSHKPRLIDLDTTSVGDNDRAIECLSLALRLAQPGTVVAYNAAMKHPYRGLAAQVEVSDMMAKVACRVPERVLSQWRQGETSTFDAQTRRAQMQTFLFYRA